MLCCRDDGWADSPPVSYWAGVCLYRPLPPTQEIPSRLLPLRVKKTRRATPTLSTLNITFCCGFSLFYNIYLSAQCTISCRQSCFIFCRHSFSALSCKKGKKHTLHLHNSKKCCNFVHEIGNGVAGGAHVDLSRCIEKQQKRLRKSAHAEHWDFNIQK